LFRSWRRSGASFGQRRPICVDQVYRAPGRSGHRALRRQRRRLLRQRSRRDDQRPVQDRSDPSTRAMALVRGRRVRDAGMGRLVQQSPAAGAHRQHPAGRSRGTLLRYARRAGHGSVTQTKMPPAIPARFTSEAEAILAWAMEGYRRLKNKTDYTLPASHEEIVARMDMQNNPVKYFLDKSSDIEIDPSGVLRI